MKRSRMVYLLIIAGIILFALINIYFENKSAEDEASKSKEDKLESVISNPFYQTYQGTYRVKVGNSTDNISAEVYKLDKSGFAKWMLVEMRNGKAEITSQKTGKWNAVDGTIMIEINGNTGVISETYRIEDGVFKSGSRYLEKAE